MRAKRRLVCVGLILALGCRTLRADVLGEGWLYRRPVQFRQALCDAPGDNVAVVEFYTNGTAQADGSDIRVTNADQVVMPSKVMQVSPGSDFVRLAFATKTDGPYYVWWGNPKAQPLSKDKQLDVKRGIYTDILKTPGNARRDTRSPSGLQRLFDEGKPEGAVFVPEIFLGYNPLGEEWDTMFHYRAQFKIDRAVTASFAYSVSNSGALRIDGKVIAEQFRGSLKGRVHDPKSVDLTVGWHTMDVTEVNLDGGRAGVVVAWKKPEDRKYEPLPSLLFAPVAQGIAGPLEKVAAPGYVGDFLIVPEGEAFSPPEFYLQRYTFDAVIPASFKPVISWDFGDGQVGGDLKRPSHVYFAPGTYTVHLRLQQGGNVFTAARRIVVQDRMYARFPRPPEEQARTMIALLKEMDLKKLTAEQALRGLMYLQDQGDTPDEILWGKTWAALKDAPTGDTAIDEPFDLARLLEKEKDYRGAATILRDASNKQVSMDARTSLMWQYVTTACDYAGDKDAALAFAQDWKKKINDNSSQQASMVKAAIVYAAVAKGDAALAQKTLATGAAEAPGKDADFNERQIRQGVLARNVENYIRTRDFDTALKLVNDWDAEFPAAIWEGFTRTLRVKLMEAEGRPMVAAQMALQHAQANPQSFYAAELLYRAAENFKAGGDQAKAKTAMDLLTSKYPESPYARGAGKGK